MPRSKPIPLAETLEKIKKILPPDHILRFLNNPVIKHSLKIQQQLNPDFLEISAPVRYHNPVPVIESEPQALKAVIEKAVREKRPSTLDKDKIRIEIYQQVIADNVNNRASESQLIRKAAKIAKCSPNTMRRAIGKLD